MVAKIEITPIGVFRCDQVRPYEAGRQPDEYHTQGLIELEPGRNFEQALLGLTPGSRIWILFLFHHNPYWNPMVLPPRGGNQKIGVFATRSPYRPNPIGISCVQILKIEKLKIMVSNSDILDGSPILDIKPYLSYADSFASEEPQWLKHTLKHQVHFEEKAIRQIEFLASRGVNQLRGFLVHQLEYEPTNAKKKRVKSVDEKFIIAYRTWRAEFLVQNDNIIITKIFSGYSVQEITQNTDPFNDKEVHREFLENFN